MAILYFDKLHQTWGTWIAVHAPSDCAGRLCDVHNRRGTGPQATWPLNWRADRGIMEVICPHGIGHPTPAQLGYNPSSGVHGCDGCCNNYDRGE